MTRTWTRDDYNDAIVSIFTRLNTAGRTLTREEVTMAWLKVGWLASSQTSGRYAGDCLLEMHQLLADVDLVAESGPLDEVVRTLSFFWAVTDRAGALLSDRHLMRGDVIRPMAAAISQNWRLISESLRHSIGRVRERGLESRVTSFNALIVAWCWKYLSNSRRGENPSNHHDISVGFS